MSLADLQGEVAALITQAHDDGVKEGIALARQDFYGQNAAFMLANIFADSLEAASARIAAHDAQFAKEMMLFAKQMRAAVQQPDVTSTVPPDVATGVAVSSTIVVKFSQDMNGASVQAAAKLTLDDAPKTAVEFKTTFDDRSRSLTITPTKLTAATAYVCTISQVAVNASGLALVGPFTFSFSTA